MGKKNTMTTYNFACIIISHGRPDSIPTVSALNKAGYVGKYFILIDDEDKCAEKYLTNYNDHVIIFHKQDFIDNNNSLFNKTMRNVAVHARNAAEYTAKQLKWDYYLLLDDDITNFSIRYIDECLHRTKLLNLTDVISEYMEYMHTANIATVGLAHEGMFIGGSTRIFDCASHARNRLLANAFLRDVRYEIIWGPDMCEDFITSINENIRAHVWVTLPFIGIQCRKQGMHKSKDDGGNSVAYINNGNYGVSKYAILAHPDCYRIARNLWFECVSYDITVPKIISDKYKVGD